LKVNTFFQMCIKICILLIILTLCINFISGLGVFFPYQTGIPTNASSETTFLSFTDGFSISTMWATVLTVLGIGAVVVAILMHSAVPVGAYLFSAIFWTSYGNALGVLDLVPDQFRIIGTAVMLFLWGGAIAGMFSGSG